MDLAKELGISNGLAKDLLLLAGDDAGLVRECSENSDSLSTLKAMIIDRRFKKVTAEEKGRDDG